MSTYTLRMAAPVVLMAITAAAAIGETLRVPADYATIQGAIDASADGDEIMVAPGTYKEAINFNGKAVYLHGADGAEQTIIDATGLNTSVVTGATGEGADTVLEGFTITGGTGTPGRHDKRSGGGMYFVGASPTVRDCRVKSNQAYQGAGAYCDAGAASFIRCEFLDNSATDGFGGGTGGGVLVRNGEVAFADCEFRGNSAQLGAGLFHGGTRLSCSGGVFADNVASTYGGGVYLGGRGAAIRGVKFHANKAIWGGGISGSYFGQALVADCVFRENSAFYADYGGSGGAMYLVKGSASIVNCAFMGNTASGGGYGHGGAIYESNSDAPGTVVAHCAFVENSADFGGALCVGSYSVFSLSNSILWSNAASEGPELWLGATDSGLPGLRVRVSHCDIAGGEAGAHVCDDCELVWGEGNIDAEPRLVDPSGGDFHLAVDSPCVEAGGNQGLADPLDVDGECRIMDGDSDGAPVADIGVDERSGAILDCNEDGDCDPLAPGEDCNQNFLPDTCELSDGSGQDCNSNGVLDACDLAAGASLDCNENGVPDECDLASGNSQDLIPPGGDGVPDDCGWVLNLTRDEYSFSVQSAIERAASGDELLVGPGVYHEAVDFHGKSLHVRSLAGPGRTTLSGRDSFGPVVTIANGETGVVIDGFTIRGGDGGVVCSWSDGWFEFIVTGGGGAFVAGGSASFRRCIFTQNHAGVGGGVYQGGGNVEILDSTFLSNSGGGFGGSDAAFRLSHCTFEENDFGVYLPNYEANYCSQYGGVGEIVGCTVRRNQGAGILAGTHRDQPIRIRDCVIEDNGRGVEGKHCSLERCLILGNGPWGGLWLRGASDVSDCVIVGNTSERGAGVYAGDGKTSIRRSAIVGNRASVAGGGVAASNSSASIRDSIVAGNDAPEGASLAALEVYDGGGALYVDFSNVAGGEAGVYLERRSSLDWGDGNLDADPGFISNPSDGGDGWGDNPDTPEFDESSNDDYGDLRLKSDSPCIDAGDPAFDPPPGATDLDGNKRIWDGNADGTPLVDMGAYEFGSHAYGDLNCDGGVDFNDIDAFVAALAGPEEYEQSYPDCAYLLADVNSDGSVDFSDIDAFVVCLINAGCP